MSTHSALGVKLPDGQIIGCYVHFDGNSMGGRIEKYLDQYTTTDLVLLIAQAQSCGGMRSFHCPPYEDENAPGESEFLDDNDLYEITAFDWRRADHGISWWWLVDYESAKIFKEHSSK